MKKNPIEPIGQATEPIKQDLVVQKLPSYKTAITLDEILLLPLPPNAEIWKIEESEMDKFPETQSILKRKKYIKADNDKETIDLKKITAMTALY